MRAYQAAGFRLPHRAALQAKAGTRVNVARRGDLVISNGGRHVSLALGDGTVIEAPQPGQKVSIHRMPRNVTAIVRIA
jgi:cell wall-associated NlpC family hydrolase